MTVAHAYTLAGKHLTNGDIDLDTNTIKVALLADSYTPDRDAHETFADVIGDEIAGTGYTTRGKTLTSPAYATSGHTEQVDFANPSWTGATFDFQYAVIYKDTGTDGTSYLIGYIDYETLQSVVASTLNLIVNANGLINLVGV